MKEIENKEIEKLIEAIDTRARHYGTSREYGLPIFDVKENAEMINIIRNWLKENKLEEI